LTDDAKQGEEDRRAGDFATVVEAHWTAVFRMLFWMSGNSHDAEELTQETFLRALQHFAEMSAETRMRPWLLRIATNAFLDAKRKQKRARRVALPPDLPGCMADPADRIEVIEQAELAKAAMTVLSETTRTVFHLRVQESLPYAEIAPMLNMTEQAARWHMHQARRKLSERKRIMRRIVSLLLVSVLVCLMSAGIADAKKKGKGKGKAVALTTEQFDAMVAKNFSLMNPNGEGLVNEAGCIEFKKVQNPNRTYYSVERGEEEGKALYESCLKNMTDKSKGFNLEAYKAYKTPKAPPKAADAPKTP